MLRHPSLVRAIAVVATAAMLAACSGGDDDGGEPAAGETSAETTTTSASSTFTPITGGTDEDGDPLPPPVHAVFSIVVRGAESWEPYTSADLGHLDEDAADALAMRLRQLEPVLAAVGIPVSVELAYGPAAALCTAHPDLLESLDRAGHQIALHARTNAESYRGVEALARCGRTAATASGLPAMADPVGPDPTSARTIADALGILSLHGIDQVTGAVSPMCVDLGLATPTNDYGTGAFTAPWRTSWTLDNPCADAPSERIVVIDQTPLAPREGEERVDESAIDVVRTRATQTLGWAADQRYKEPEELPAPGMLTWGVTVRLEDLLPAVDEPDDEADEADEDADEAQDEPATRVDLRTAPLSEETLTALADLLEEWRPAVDDGRLVWLTPAAAAEILRGG